MAWCPYGQSCRGALCQLWDMKEEECLLRVNLQRENKLLLFKLRGKIT
jgi:hypothetical protein